MLDVRCANRMISAHDGFKVSRFQFAGGSIPQLGRGLANHVKRFVAPSRPDRFYRLRSRPRVPSQRPDRVADDDRVEHDELRLPVPDRPTSRTNDDDFASWSPGVAMHADWSHLPFEWMEGDDDAAASRPFALCRARTRRSSSPRRSR